LTCSHTYSDDINWDDIDPDKLKNGINDYPLSQDKEMLYGFFARYVRKAHSDSVIKNDVRSNEGLSFVDIISPSNIAFVISVIKNGRNVWNQTLRMRELGAAVNGERKVKLRLLFTDGTRKKKEQVKSLCSDEEMKYFKLAEKKVRGI
jgi:hypothetical protein